MEMFAHNSLLVGDGRSRTLRALHGLATEDWRVMCLPERSAHLVVGRCGAFLVVTEDPDGHHWAQLLESPVGVQRVIVTWRDLPEEVTGLDGTFVVRGDVLPAFLRAQGDLLDTYEFPKD